MCVQKGKSRFVILLTDMLLVLKPKRKGKFGGRGNSQNQFIDWFTEVDCKAKTVSADVHTYCGRS